MSTIKSNYWHYKFLPQIFFIILYIFWQWERLLDGNIVKKTNQMGERNLCLKKSHEDYLGAAAILRHFLSAFLDDIWLKILSSKFLFLYERDLSNSTQWRDEEQRARKRLVGYDIGTYKIKIWYKNVNVIFSPRLWTQFARFYPLLTLSHSRSILGLSYSLLS